tara:strand:+ start:1699 stop:2070 length:372 start_codon:yes stop_codon:yes gene_type:complete
MNRLILTLAFVFAGTTFSSAAEQYYNIEPQLKCHYPRKNRGICNNCPNFSRRTNICDPTLMGHIEWCREDVNITERDDCGNYQTYDAVVVTYREVFENGAWGDKFRRTYRKDPTLITPRVLYK